MASQFGRDLRDRVNACVDDRLSLQALYNWLADQLDDPDSASVIGSARDREVAHDIQLVLYEWEAGGHSDEDARQLIHKGLANSHLWYLDLPHDPDSSTGPSRGVRITRTDSPHLRAQNLDRETPAQV